MEDADENNLGGYKGMWEIRGMMYLNGFRIHCNGVLICRICSQT